MAGYRAVSNATGTDATGEGTHPTGVQNGDFLIAFVTHSASSATITGAPTGWTAEIADPNPADFSTWCYTKVYATGDASPTWTFSAAGNWTVDIIAISAPGSTPVNQKIGEQGAAINTISLGAITPNVNDCVLVGYAATDASGGARTWTVPGTMTEVLDQMNNAIHRAIAYEVLSGGQSAQTRDFTVSGSAQDIAGFLLAIAPVAGTQYNQSISGAITPAGALTKRAGKVLTGGVTSAGTLNKRAATAKAGTLTMAGGVTKQTETAKSGVLSFSGALATAKVFLKVLAGTLTMDGSLTKRTGKVLAGLWGFTGNVTRETRKTLAGVLTSAGGLVAELGAQVFYQTVGGVLTFAGTVTKRTGKTLTGSVGFVGAVIKRTGKAVTGVLTMSGAVSAARVIVKVLGGVLTFSGGLVKRTEKRAGGEVGFTGQVTKAITKSFAGVLDFIGGLITAFVPGNLETSATRVYAIEAENRTFGVVAERRVMAVAGEARLILVEQDPRIYAIIKEDRTAKIGGNQ